MSNKVSRRLTDGVIATVYMPILRSAARLLLAGSALLILPATAEAQFSAPFPLSQPSTGDTTVQVAVTPAGDAMVTWVAFDGTNYRVQARSRTITGVLGPVRTLSFAGQDASAPFVGIDAQGNAVVTWRRFDGTNWRVQARAISAAGVLGPIRTLSQARRDAVGSQIAVDADGDAVVTWMVHGANYHIQARALSRTGELGPIQILSRFGRDAYGARVGADAAGDSLVTWYSFDGTKYRVDARLRSADGVLGPIQTLSTNAAFPEVAVDATGGALITWEYYDGTKRQVQARFRSATGVLGPIQTLSNAGYGWTWPRVALDDKDNGVVTWTWYDGANYWVQGRTRSATGVLGPIQTLSEAGAYNPQLAMDDQGDALVTWQRRLKDSTYATWNWRIQGRTISVSDVVGPIEMISAAGQDSYGAQPALDADGSALVAWEHFDGTSSQVMGSSATTP